jgi:hypothetical protein
MNDMESRKFEDAFRDAFKEAEVSPTENVWTNIELDLEKAEGDKMKRRIFFYKLLAAASIAFAMSVAGVGYYILQDQQRFDGSLAVNPKTESSSERNAQTRTGETAGNDQVTENIADNSKADQAISSDNAIVNGQANSGTANEQTATSSSPVFDDNNNNENPAENKSIASLNTHDENTPADSENKSNNKASAIKRADQSNSTQRQAKTNGSSSNTEKTNSTSDRANQNSIAKTEQKSINPGKQSNTADHAAQNAVASRDGKQNNSQRNAQSTESTVLSSDKNTKGMNAIANTSSQQVAANDAFKNSDTPNQQNQISSATDGQNTVASVNVNKAGQEVNGKTISADNGIDSRADKQGIASNEHVGSGNDKNNASVNTTSAIANDKQQGVAAVDNKNALDSSPAGNKNGVDINPFSRYYTANNGEFGAVNNTSTLASNEGVKKLPSRVDKPVDFDATKLMPQVDPLMLMLAKLDEEGKSKSEEQKKEEDNNTEKLWTSVGFAAGSFNTVNSNASTSQSFAMNNVASQQAKASGSSYTVGLSMGTRLSKRWVVQGGVNYMTQSSDYTSNAVGASSDFSNFSAPAVNSMMSEADSRLVSTAPYTINNSLRFVSIPLQAGYMIVNKRFGIQLNGGVSTDMFLQNTLTPESDNVSKTTQGSGEDSPYRTFNFSGLVGTEFSYKFGQHYRLALNPGIRYPFNSIYKSDQPITAMPLTFDVGLRFRYIFH